MYFRNCKTDLMSVASFHNNFRLICPKLRKLCSITFGPPLFSVSPMPSISISFKPLNSLNYSIPPIKISSILCTTTILLDHQIVTKLLSQPYFSFVLFFQLMSLPATKVHHICLQVQSSISVRLVFKTLSLHLVYQPCQPSFYYSCQHRFCYFEEFFNTPVVVSIFLLPVTSISI